VLVALVKSGREAPVEVPPPLTEPPPNQEPPEPQVVVIDHHDQPVERIREVPVAVPVFIPVSSSRLRHRPIDRSFDASEFVPFQSGPPAARPVRAPEPVYWGWGGKRRPDSWDPARGEVKPPDRRK
jgi:hypothetical protein